MNDTLKSLPDLTDLSAFCKITDLENSYRISGRLWCPSCKFMNRFVVHPEFLTVNEKLKTKAVKSMHGGYDGTWIPSTKNKEVLIGSQFSFICTRCQVRARVLIQKVHGKVENLIFFENGGSIATTNTPENVRYYLEQSYACRTVKAYSACFAMYRTALDAVLFNEGYKTGMVGEKIARIEKDLQLGKAPTWITNLHTEYLKVIKNIGNSSLHIAGEDISAEIAIDDSDIRAVEIAFSEILFLVYEKAVQEATRLEDLQQLSVKKKK